MGQHNGTVLEFSMIGHANANQIGAVSVFPVNSIARSTDDKTVLTTNPRGNFEERNLSTSDNIINYPITGGRWMPGKSAIKCVKTHDKKFLITAPYEKNQPLDIYSVETFEQVHSWEQGVIDNPKELDVSQDNRYQFIGYPSGILGIYDLKNYKTIGNFQVLSGIINSVSFSRDNTSAFLSNLDGNIKMIKWQAGATSEGEFDLTEEPKQVGNGHTFKICLTTDEKYLLVGSDGLL